MPYQVDRTIREQNHLRFHAAERHRIERLEARDLLIRIDNVAVDAEQLVLRPFACDSRWCLRRVEKDGQTKYKGCCCTDLEVDVTAQEVERLRELGKLALEKLTFKPRDPLGEIARRMADGDLTETTETGDTAFIHLKSGRCPLGLLTREGALLCGINALCAEMNLPLPYYKPEPCFIFPLHYVEHEPGQFYLTVVCEETHRAIGADAYVTKLRCLRKPKPGAPPAYVWLRGEIELCFGAEFYRELERAARPYLAAAGTEGES